MTPLAVSIVGTIASIALVLIVLELIRSRRLRERYALLWLATGVVLAILCAWREGLNTIARWVGVRSYPPAVLFAVGIVFILAVLDNTFNQLEVNAFLKDVVRGVILIAAIAVYARRQEVKG